MLITSDVWRSLTAELGDKFPLPKAKGDMCTRMIYRLLTESDELEGCREQGQCQAGWGMEEFEWGWE